MHHILRLIFVSSFLIAVSSFLIAFSVAVTAQEAPVPTPTPANNDTAKDIARGKRIFNLQCRACHSIDAGEPHKVGPNLHGMMTRPAGTASEFKYSTPFKAAAIQWDAQKLDRWLRKPGEMISGTTMAFEGLGADNDKDKNKDRAAIVAYLLEATAMVKP